MLIQMSGTAKAKAWSIEASLFLLHGQCSLDQACRRDCTKQMSELQNSLGLGHSKTNLKKFFLLLLLLLLLVLLLLLLLLLLVLLLLFFFFFVFFFLLYNLNQFETSLRKFNDRA